MTNLRPDFEDRLSPQEISYANARYADIGITVRLLADGTFGLWDMFSRPIDRGIERGSLESALQYHFAFHDFKIVAQPREPRREIKANIQSIDDLL